MIAISFPRTLKEFVPGMDAVKHVARDWGSIMFPRNRFEAGFESKMSEDEMYDAMLQALVDGMELRSGVW